MSFAWERLCYKCHRPICVYVNTDDPGLLIHAVRFYMDVPIDLTYNTMYLKFYGLRVKRVCAHCFHNKLNLSPQNIMNREIGKKVKFEKKSYTKTAEQINTWNRHFYRYLKNCVQ